MDSLSLKYLGESTVSFEDIAGKGVKQLTFNQIALEQAGPYAAEDADITLRLHQTLWSQLQEEPSLDDLVLLSESQEGQQNCLNKTCEYCKSWGLEINYTKSKVMIFNKGSRL
jgi:hypothetical protein